MNEYDGGSMAGSGIYVGMHEVFLGCDRCYGETHAEVDVEQPVYEVEVECEHCGYEQYVSLEV